MSMSLELIDPNHDMALTLQAAIAAAIPGAQIEVSTGGPGHFSIAVTSEAFRDKSPVAKQQLVYTAIADFMRGDNPPVHAIDRLQTLLPACED